MTVPEKDSESEKFRLSDNEERRALYRLHGNVNTVKYESTFGWPYN
jgi:hypothetical protein